MIEFTERDYRLLIREEARRIVDDAIIRPADLRTSLDRLGELRDALEAETRKRELARIQKAQTELVRAFDRTAATVAL